ncbi:AAA family ATPase [Leptolyngbya ohadii]|uniref:AAA family ATPase n=1 Tax=Leptolyngbya ohadii TaxID=1962290 RepID=UPI000B59F986|nr:AAA family ATPase [Leptolyngbya ohadii]
MDVLPTNDRHIQIQRDAIGSAIVSGEGNTVFIYQYQLAQAEIPKAPQASALVELAPNPYKGLLAFHETDGDRFFGREKQIEQLWQKLRDLYEDIELIRLLPIYGPSGSGKSSLARAGLIPELARRPLPGRVRARVAILVPGSHPLEALAAVLAQIATNDRTPVAKTREFAGEMSQPNSVGEYDGLRRIADVLPENPTTPLIVLVDQFEETYTLCQDQAERDAFIGNLLCAASDRSRRVSVIVTLRSDFLGETQKHPVLNRLFSSQGFLVPAMSEEELCEAIRKPAELAGHPLDEATIQLLLEQAEGREGALPLLQFALTRIWEGIGEGVAPAVTLERMGGIGGALAGEAQRVFDSLSLAEQAIARRVFLGLVQLGEGTKDTRRRVIVDNLASYKDDDAQVQKVVERFSDPGVRLITLGASESGQETAEVSHEALFDHWQLLDRWLEESRSDLRFQRRLEEAAQYWEQNGRPNGSLWRSPDLDLLRRFAGRSGEDMTPVQLKFFQASVRAERRSKLLQWSAVSSLVALTAFAFWQTWSARRGEERAFAQRLVAQAESINARSPGLFQTSALLAVEANKQFEQLGESSLDVDRVMRSVLLFLPFPLNELKHGGVVRSASFSSDGTKVITGSFDNTARIWDSVTGKELARLAHEDRVGSVSFSPDGTKVITGSDDKTARIWTVSSRNFANEICSRVTRNLTVREWESYVSSLSQYELVCGNLPVHSTVLDAARDAVVQDKVSKALAIFDRAKSLQPDIDLDPTTPEPDRDPRTTVKTIAAAEKVKRGSELAKSGEIDNAIRLYQEAQKTIALSANQWNSLCWLGSLHRRAADVMFACDQAVSLDSSNQWIHKSRGIARSVAGDIPGAIEDLQIFVNSLDPNAQATAPEKQWIDQLRAGQNPFTDELLKNLLQG